LPSVGLLHLQYRRFHSTFRWSVLPSSEGVSALGTVGCWKWLMVLWTAWWWPACRAETCSYLFRSVAYYIVMISDIWLCFDCMYMWIHTQFYTLRFLLNTTGMTHLKIGGQVTLRLPIHSSLCQDPTGVCDQTLVH
jgi:hypothetical protein